MKLARTKKETDKWLQALLYFWEHSQSDIKCKYEPSDKFEKKVQVFLDKYYDDYFLWLRGEEL